MPAVITAARARAKIFFMFVFLLKNFLCSQFPLLSTASPVDREPADVMPLYPPPHLVNTFLRCFCNFSVIFCVLTEETANLGRMFRRFIRFWGDFGRNWEEKSSVLGGIPASGFAHCGKLSGENAPRCSKTAGDALPRPFLPLDGSVRSTRTYPSVFQRSPCASQSSCRWRGCQTPGAAPSACRRGSWAPRWSP